MTTIITDTIDINRIVSELPKDAEIFASTFNISTWMSNGPAQALLQDFNMRNSSVLVGVPKFRPCTGQYGHGSCRHCYSRHRKGIKNLATLRDKYTNITWKFVANHHAKFIISSPWAIVGGRNITDSKIEDLSFVDKNETLCRKLRSIWDRYSEADYDIGTDGPLVFTTPFNGELMADSSFLAQEYKDEAVKNFPTTEVGIYWAK